MKTFESGFIKRAIAYGYSESQAVQLLKTAFDPDSKEGRKNLSKKLVPQNFIGAVGDYISNPGFGSYRAGKATALSKSLGHEPGFATTNPVTAGMLSSSVGGITGGSIGHML